MIELLNMDCMEYMAGCEDNAFDLAIVDPPYGIGVKVSMGRRKGQAASGYHKFYGEDKEPPKKEYFDELIRVSREQVIWGANYFGTKPTNCIVIWDKMQEFSGATFELAWTSFSSPSKAFRMSRAEAYCGSGKIHPTQKPRALYTWLLENYAKPGQRILDTHLGSGSSAIAAHYFGCDFVGTELDPDYYAAALERFNNETSQAQLFEPEVVIEPEQEELL